MRKSEDCVTPPVVGNPVQGAVKVPKEPVSATIGQPSPMARPQSAKGIA